MSEAVYQVSRQEGVVPKPFGCQIPCQSVQKYAKPGSVPGSVSLRQQPG